jgi:hypothetical protein
MRGMLAVQEHLRSGGSIEDLAQWYDCGRAVVVAGGGR